MYSAVHFTTDDTVSGVPSSWVHKRGFKKFYSWFNGEIII